MKTKKPLDNIIIFISPTCVHCHNLIKSLPLDVFEKMKIVNSTKVSKRVQEKIPHVPYIVNKNGKPLKVKGKITYEKLMRFSNSFGENIEKYKKVPTPRPQGSIRMKRPFGHILELLPFCDTITHLKSYCTVSKDGTLAPFTKRIVDSKEQELVGADDMYTAVCRKYL